MNTRILDKDMGIMLMEGEELLLKARPNSRFVHYAVITACLTIVGIVTIPLVALCATVAQSRYRYWLTNRRVIISSGFIGYRVRSIPLERVSDVAFSRTFPEMLAGIQSVIVRDMTGEAESGKVLFAIDNAAEVQKRILEEVQRVNSQQVVW